MSRATDKLSDIAIRQAKPREKAYKLQDGGQMYLLVKLGDHKYWMMDYKFQDKRNTATSGSHPEASLNPARKAKRDAKELLTQGMEWSNNFGDLKLGDNIRHIKISDNQVTSYFYRLS